MADLLDEKHNETGTNFAATPAAAPAARTSADTAAEARKARIKKMRGWLSPRDTVADDFGPEDAALYYGEGHSGWNR
ncbi:hypothetical protein SAMN05720470_11530 [Fibrobacter sp. UWOV1]|uniref:hypothetical protein n=1 Tax=Fibrobacter sp. UWOV1 TaxID=1896215 RepID=UPI000913E8DD|nr:hypothetical protein [Fibrobacter sp. UWOV1]SHL77045.1 hypothetical protein SAMN05720470_11530 [Fibrobacter sp. UWOV1]